MRLPPSEPHPELDALLAKARTYVMTADERAAQRKSWVVGEMMLEHPDMTREEAVRVYDDVSYR
jgi:hypothetical protein